MQKADILTALLGVMVLLGAACSTGEARQDYSGQIREWAFLFYDDADFYDAYDPWDDFIPRMYSSDNLHVLVLRDRGQPHGGIYYINPDQSYEKVEHMPNINMGDPATLTRFIQFCKKNYPASRNIVSFYDHGGGFRGACMDSSHNDWLYMEEIGRGLENGGGVDMVLFSAPCLMGAIECMYELRNRTRVYIGSEALSGFCYWKYALDDIRLTLTDTPGINTIELGARIISLIEDKLWMVENQYYGSTRFITMSAVRTDKLGGLVSLFDEICRYYADHPAKYNAYLNGQYDEIETYGEENDFNMDMFSLASHLIRQETDPVMVARLTELRDRIREAVVAEIHGWMYPDSHGIAIHHPHVETFFLHEEWNTWYQQVEFASATRWDDVMINYLGIRTLTVNGMKLPRDWIPRRGTGMVPGLDK
jgi:hypothetical protein